MTPISIEAAARVVRASPAPVFVIDTCNLLDVVRVDTPRREPHVDPNEIRTVLELTTDFAGRPPRVHLVVPELVPQEYDDNLAGRLKDLADWVRHVDQQNAWLALVGGVFGTSAPPPNPAAGSGIADQLRALSRRLLDGCHVLSRDPTCVDRALARLTSSPRRRPSHNKELKDSLNVEQCIELATLLRRQGFALPVAWVSSNVNDFAATKSTQIHPDLRAEFAAVDLHYFVTLSAAVGRLRADGYLQPQ